MEEQMLVSQAPIDTLNILRSPTISVVIPARNEAQNLRHVLPFIPASVSEVILVDGHSADGTIEEALKIMPTIRVIRQHGKGKGDALREGFAACTGDIIVMLDADGSADPTELPRFVEALEQGYDFAKGSRFMAGGGSVDITHLRRWGNALLSMFVNVLFDTKFSDLCYGYNAFWKHCLNQVVVDCDGFEVETQLNLRMHTTKMKIIEIPSFEHARIHGKSNLHAARDGWRVLQTILCEWSHQNKKTSTKPVIAQTYPKEAANATKLSYSVFNFDINIQISIKKKAV